MIEGKHIGGDQPDKEQDHAKQKDDTNKTNMTSPPTKQTNDTTSVTGS